MGMTRALRRLPIATTVTPTSVTMAAEEASLELFASEGALGIGERALGWFEEATREVKERLPPPRPLGCADGCAFCCHLKVTVSPPELIHLTRHIRRTRTEGDIATLICRLHEAHAKTLHLDTIARADLRLPCPLLENDRCTAYEARPLHCAGANAYDPKECEDAFTHIDQDVAVSLYMPQAQIADVIAAGISRASFGKNRAGAMLELISALLLSLEEPGRDAAWERGEDAFAEARDRELEALIAATPVGSSRT